MQAGTLEEQLFGFMFNGTHAVLAIHRESQVVLAVNQSLEHLLGHQVGELLGIDAAGLFERGESLDCPLASVLSRPGLHDEVALRRCDSYPVIVSMNVSHLHHPVHGAVAACITTDITERRLLERELIAKHTALYAAHAELEQTVGQLRATQERLEHRNREIAALGAELAGAARRAAIGELSAGIAHSINNPMAALVSTLAQLRTQVVDHGCKQLSRRVDRLFVRAETVVARMERIVTTVRHAHRSGQLSRDPVVLDIAAELTLALDLLESQLQGVEVVVRHEEPARGFAPADAFHHVISNLIGNAIEAMPCGGRLCIESSQRGSETAIEITDTGPGVPKELKSQLFEPFISGRETGTGLGLSIAERFARDWGGCLRLLPSDRGARFEVTIPREAP